MLTGDFGSGAPPRLVAFDALSTAPTGIHEHFAVGDRLRLSFDRPTDRSIAMGNRKYVDSLFAFSQQLGVDYSGEWTDASTMVISLLTPSPTSAAPNFGTTQVEVVGDIRNTRLQPSGKMAPAFLAGDYGSDAPPRLVKYEVVDPDNADTVYSDADTLLLVFDMPTDRGVSGGGKRFVDNLLEFSSSVPPHQLQLGIDYSAEWTDASTLTITSLATHPNFLGFDADPAVAAARARCRWGDPTGATDGYETLPTLVEPMRVECPSYLHDTPGERTLQLTLNAEDYTPLAPDYGYYADPPLAAFSTALEPEGGVSKGGTIVTVRGEGFDALPKAGVESVLCRWGSIYAAGNDTKALNVSATQIVCPSSPLPEGLQNLSIALNGQQFIATNLQLRVYPQPSGFSQVALNTSELGLGAAKYYGHLVGAPLGLVAEVWLRGEGFLAFQNASTAFAHRKLRCRWGSERGAPETKPLRVEEDLVVCPSSPSASAGEVALFVALNAVDFAATGMSFKHYRQPTTFSRQMQVPPEQCAVVFDHRCATGLFPTGGVNEGGTSVTIFEGFAAFRTQPELASCRWGDDAASAAITTPTDISEERIVCPSPARVEVGLGLGAGRRRLQAGASPDGNDHAADDDAGSIGLAIALNGVHFTSTPHRFKYYQQPLNFSSISPTGGALDSLTAVTVRGEGFLAFSNSSSRARCRWGADTNGTLLEAVREANGTMHETPAIEISSCISSAARTPRRTRARGSSTSRSTASTLADREWATSTTGSSPTCSSRRPAAW